MPELPLPPIVVELRMEFPPILANEYTLTEYVEDITRFRSRVHDKAAVVAQIREYADQLELVWQTRVAGPTYGEPNSGPLVDLDG